MKTLKYFLFFILMLSMNFSCQAQTSNKNDKENKISSEVEVYYFHFTRRCVTCNAIESVTREAVKEYYGDKVPFADFDLNDEKGKETAKKLKVSGQTLLIVSGETQVNLTNEAFRNARNNPEKLKQIIKENIDSLL